MIDLTVFFKESALLSVSEIYYTKKSTTCEKVCTKSVNKKPFSSRGCRECRYSHSIVPGGFEVKSYNTLFTSFTSLIMVLEISVKSFLLNI